MRYFIFFLLFNLTLVSCKTEKNKNIYKYNKDKTFKIISLAPSITRVLAELNQINNIVGISSYCFLADSLKNCVIGNLIELNVEKIFLLKPDIVFLTNFANKSDINILKKSNIEVYVLPKMSSFDDIMNNYLEIAKIVKQEKLAQKNIVKYKNKLDSLINIVKNKNKNPKIFFQISTNPIFGVIPETFMDDLIKYAGGINILSELKRPMVSREYVLFKNPDVIFISIMGQTANDEINKWKNYKFLNAIKNNKIFILNPDTACQPTPSNFLITLEKMVKLMYD